jgi:hypothetical protein
MAEAIHRTQPTGYGQRNRKLFDLARALKAIPCYADGPAEGCLEVVRDWWELALPNIRTKAWDESWRDFRVAWGRVQQPARGCTLAGLKEWVFSLVPLADAFDREEGDLLRLELLCEALHGRHGGRPFPLACRVVAEVLGVGKTTGARHLGRLVRARVLRVAAPAVKGKRRAAEYLYAGPSFALSAEAS